jgi:hypothetical protein
VFLLLVLNSALHRESQLKRTMRLPDDIRSLHGRKQLHRNRRLKIACHEASHAIVALRVENPFLYLELLKVEKEDHASFQEVLAHMVFAHGRKRDQRDAIDDAATELAGYAYEAILYPHTRGIGLLTGAMNDWRQAMQSIQFSGIVGDDRHAIDRYIEYDLLPIVHGMIISDWDTIMRIGEMLAAKGRLSYAEVVEIVENHCGPRKPAFLLNCSKSRVS